MNESPVVNRWDDNSAKLLSDNREQYFRQSAQWVDGKQPSFREVNNQDGL